MKHILYYAAFLIIFISLSCGKKKDKQDTLEIGVTHPNGQSEELALGSSVKAYASGNLYLEGVTDYSEQNITKVLFTVEDKLYDLDGENGLSFIHSVIITHGDSISNVTGVGEELDNFNFSFKSKSTDNQVKWYSTSKSYFGLLKGSTWKLTTGAVNGTFGTLASCALDNTIEFADHNPRNTYQFLASYKENDDVCSEVSGDFTISLFAPVNFVAGTINGSVSKYSSANGGFYISGTDYVTVNKVHLIGVDTLVLSGTLAGDVIDYYFVP